MEFTLLFYQKNIITIVSIGTMNEAFMFFVPLCYFACALYKLNEGPTSFLPFSLTSD